MIETTDQSTWGGPRWGNDGHAGVSGEVEMDEITHDRINAAFDLMNLQGGEKFLHQYSVIICITHACNT